MWKRLLPYFLTIKYLQDESVWITVLTGQRPRGSGKERLQATSMSGPQPVCTYLQGTHMLHRTVRCQLCH